MSFNPEFITSASAYSIYEQHYASSFTVHEFFNIATLDPTTKLPEIGDWLDPLVKNGSDHDYWSAMLSKATLGKFTRQLLVWASKSPEIKDYFTHRNSSRYLFVYPKPLYLFLVDRTSEFTLTGFAKFVSDYITDPEAHPWEWGTGLVSEKSVKPLLTLFDASYKSLPEGSRSINGFRTYDDFVRFFAETVPETAVAELEKTLKSEIKVYFEDENEIDFTPLTYRASTFYTSGAQWCTAKPDSGPSHFNSYTNNGTLVVLMDKKDKTRSVQIFYPGEDSSYGFEARDFYDDSVSTETAEALTERLNSRAGTDFSAEETERVYYSYEMLPSLNYPGAGVFGAWTEVDFLETKHVEDVDGNDDDSRTIFSLRMELAYADYNHFDFSLFSDAPEVNFSNPGLVLAIPDNVDEVDLADGREGVFRSLSHRLAEDAFDGDVETLDPIRPYDLVKADLVGGYKPPEDEKWKVSIPAFGYILLLSESKVGDISRLLHSIFSLTRSGEGLSHVFVSGFSVLELQDVFYGTNRFRYATVYYNSGDGDMATAMQEKPWFAEMVASGKPVTSKVQRELDQQLDLPLEG